MAPNEQAYNEDELEAPSWMNNEFFEKVLRHCEKSQDIELKRLKLTPATGKGGHYASVMFRVVVDYCLNNEDKTKSMIIKAMPENEGNKTEMFKESLIFETEIGMYSEIIPKFEATLRAAGDDTILGVKCLYRALSPKKTIIFEDLIPLGYEVMQGLQTNLAEVKSLYAKLAKWHAVSYKMNLEDPHIFDNYNNGLFMQAGLRNSDSFNDGITNFIDLLDSHEDLRQYKPYFEPFVGKIVDECFKSFTEARQNLQTNGLYVLSHGDFHHKNLMFKRDLSSQKLLDAMLLDFQMCYFGPMVNDILYSIYMVLDVNLRSNHLDEILYFYFTTFQETLRKIDYKGEIPKMLQFRQQLMRHKNFELFLFVTFLPMWYVFADGEITLEEMILDAELRKQTFHDPRYVDEVRSLLPKFLYTGYLEK